MTCPSLTLESVTYLLPDGSPLFSDLTTRIDQRRTGLVGRNGVGKSVLGRILAGALPTPMARPIRSACGLRCWAWTRPVPTCPPASSAAASG
ncbi:hypothetical protein [Xanthomonas campestris]|uniref:hypothetical protein n=1 Tax=Xanthomonas campestris TaxID=339 RepID=UPI00388D0747